jgi:predicted nuclease of predicted toxin-antitoxin system
MRFLADESCDFAVVCALRAAGHDVQDVQAVKEICSGAPDEMVMQLAVQETRILLTEDKDFGQLVYAGSGLSVGVIFIRFPGNARQGMVKAVLELLDKAGDKLQGRFVVVHPAGYGFPTYEGIAKRNPGTRSWHQLFR